MCNSSIQKSFISLENMSQISAPKTSMDLISPLSSAGVFYVANKAMGYNADSKAMLYQAGSSFLSNNYSDMVLPKLGLQSTPIYKAGVCGLVYSSLDYLMPWDGRSFIYKTLLSAGSEFVSEQYVRQMLPL